MNDVLQRRVRQDAPVLGVGLGTCPAAGEDVQGAVTTLLVFSSGREEKKKSQVGCLNDAASQC